MITVEQGSAEPIAGVTLSVGEATAVTGPQGTALVTAPQGAEVAATAIGYDPASGTVPDDGDLTLTLRSNVVSGTITDQGGDPVAGARVFVDGQTTWVRSDQRGAYALPGVPAEGTLIVKLAGYRLAEFPRRRIHQGRCPRTFRGAGPVRTGCRVRGSRPAGPDAAPD